MDAHPPRKLKQRTWQRILPWLAAAVLAIIGAPRPVQAEWPDVLQDLPNPFAETPPELPQDTTASSILAHQAGKVRFSLAYGANFTSASDPFAVFANSSNNNTAATVPWPVSENGRAQSTAAITWGRFILDEFEIGVATNVRWLMLSGIDPGSPPSDWSGHGLAVDCTAYLKHYFLTRTRFVPYVGFEGGGTMSFVVGGDVSAMSASWSALSASQKGDVNNGEGHWLAGLIGGVDFMLSAEPSAENRYSALFLESQWLMMSRSPLINSGGLGWGGPETAVLLGGIAFYY
jgi:hypothetical protein